MQTERFKQPGLNTYTECYENNAKIPTPEEFIVRSFKNWKNEYHDCSKFWNENKNRDSTIGSYSTFESYSIAKNITKFIKMVEVTTFATGCAIAESNENSYCHHIACAYSDDLRGDGFNHNPQLRDAVCKNENINFKGLCAECDFDIFTKNNALYNMNADSLNEEAWHIEMYRKNPNLDKEFNALGQFDGDNCTLPSGLLFQPLQTIRKMLILKKSWKYYCEKNCQTENGIVKHIMCNTPDVSNFEKRLVTIRSI